jgi:hypothetical protein
MHAPERAWLLCPRPFADETFGSWFGRVAARYRLDVDQLAAAADIQLDLGPNYERWADDSTHRNRCAIAHLLNGARDPGCAVGTGRQRLCAFMPN